MKKIFMLINNIKYKNLIIMVMSWLFFGASVFSKPLHINIDSWIQKSSLPILLADSKTLHIGNNLIVLGGKDENDAPSKNIYITSIQENGGVNWTTGQQMHVSVYTHAAVSYKQFVYVLGGWDGSRFRNDVWRASLTNGTLGSWSQASTLPQALNLHDATVANDRIYIVGGWTGFNALNKIYSAKIRNDGSLEQWRPEKDLDKPLYRLAVAASANTLYVTGGYDGSNVSNLIYYASINTDGSLGAWQTKQMPVAREYHQSVIHDGRLVLLGGRNAGNPGGLNRVDAAPINPDGGLGNWQSLPSLPQPLFRFGAVAVPKYGY